MCPPEEQATIRGSLDAPGKLLGGDNEEYPSLAQGRPNLSQGISAMLCLRTEVAERVSAI